MSMEFGWWIRLPELGKFKVRANIHGGNLTWRRKQGHHTQWETHTPSPEDWDRLIAEAESRVPRRLISPKQMAEILRICASGRR
jgi:hypothetical protein